METVKKNNEVAKKSSDDKTWTSDESETSSNCLDKNSFLIYLSHFLSSFGDRIWGFAVGIYLYHLFPCSLLLTAVYGLSTCASLFVFGAPVGRWIDKSKRLHAARFTILVQNASVVFGAALMASTIHYKQQVQTLWNGQFVTLLYAAIILIAIVAELASMANKIVLEKDWIVVLARGNKRKLSNLNATMRTINLSCKIIAPFVVGHILTFFSNVAGAIFIGTWNIISALGEYYLLYIIFAAVPELSNKKTDDRLRDNIPLVQITTPDSNSPDKPTSFPSPVDAPSGDSARPETMKTPTMQGYLNIYPTGINTNNNEPFSSQQVFEEISLATPTPQNGENESSQGSVDSSETNDEMCGSVNKSNLSKMCNACNGWQQFFSNHVKFAGIGLASLYMTVLSFDGIMIGFLSSQGMSAGLVGNISAVAALVGILGSLSFPYLRRKCGKNAAGMLGFGLEAGCLLICLASIVGPGSPFYFSAITQEFDISCRNKDSRVTQPVPWLELWENRSHLILLSVGIAAARYGLWIADLSVTQIFQEEVIESQRGAVSGVQGALNQLMSLLKYALVIVLPHPETFGYLIGVSWLFVFLGWVFFMMFVCRDTRKRNKVQPQAQE